MFQNVLSIPGLLAPDRSAPVVDSGQADPLSGLQADDSSVGGKAGLMNVLTTIATG